METISNGRIQDNAFPVKIASEPQDARAWRGRGIVVDLFRFSTTVCALLKSGRGDIRICSGPAYAAAVKAVEKGSDLFSEIDFPPEVDKYDNSPYIALYASAASRPALIVTNSGSPAVMSLVSAEEILIACFANLPFAAEYCRAKPMDTLIVPACLFYDRKHVEDVICAGALSEAIAGGDPSAAAIEAVHGSGRVLDFMSFRPETGKRDVEITLKNGSLDVVPRVKLLGAYGVVENIYKESKQ
jgi:phosphosulfolactate phosphohydrolase-like enzyme